MWSKAGINKRRGEEKGRGFRFTARGSESGGGLGHGTGGALWVHCIYSAVTGLEEGSGGVTSIRRANKQVAFFQPEVEAGERPTGTVTIEADDDGRWGTYCT